MSTPAESFDKTLFLFVRHGAADSSEWNQKIYQGYGTNLVPLSAEGVRQVEAAAADPRLAGADLILSSPFTRALQSAAILSRALDAPIAVETDLHEWVANKHYIYADDKEAEAAYIEYVTSGGCYPPGEEREWEDAETIRRRVLGVLRKYTGRKKVLIAAHGMLIHALTGTYPENGGIVEFGLPEE